MNAEEVRSYDGQSVTMSLVPGALVGQEVRGRVVGLVEAADGLIIVLHPEGSEPEARASIHYQHIVEIKKQA